MLAFLFIIYILALPFIDILQLGLAPPTEDDEEIFDPAKLKEESKISSYEAAYHPEDGELYRVMKDFHEAHKGDAKIAQPAGQ